MTLPQYAKEFAVKAHYGQTYGNKKEPYHVHLEEVAEWARYYNLGRKVESLCYLHDVLEDTDCIFEDLQREFGLNSAAIVHDLSDFDKKQSNFSEIARTEAACLTKMCDRLANVTRSIIEENPRFLRRYLEQHVHFEFTICKALIKFGYGDVVDDYLIVMKTAKETLQFLESE